MVNVNALAGKMRECQKTQKEIARLLGITEAALSSKMTRKSKFYIDEVEVIMDLLEIKESEEIKRIFFYKEVA